MYKFEIEPLALQDACLIRHPVFADGRGRFSVTSHQAEFAARSLQTEWVQENESFSRDAFTVRGLHAQHPPFEQAKLVRCVAGSILDIIVDARQDSPSFGHSVAVELAPSQPRMLFVPRGFLHGFMTLEPDCIVNYKVDGEYSPEHDFSVAWDDSELALDWPSEAENVILSEKDRNAQSWRDFVRKNQFRMAHTTTGREMSV